MTIDNNSGKKYVDAKLKLIAGEVNVAQPQPTYQPIMYVRSFASPAAGAAVP